jgi:hypothetical protein
LNGRKRSLWRVGGFVVFIGLIVDAFGVLNLMIVPPCPAQANQCASTSIYLDIVYAGTGLIIIGAGMMIASLVM